MQKLAVSSVLAGRQHSSLWAAHFWAGLGLKTSVRNLPQNSMHIVFPNQTGENWKTSLVASLLHFSFFYVIKKGWVNWNTGYSALPFLRDHCNPGALLTCSSNVSPCSLALSSALPIGFTLIGRRAVPSAPQGSEARLAGFLIPLQHLELAS